MSKIVNTGHEQRNFWTGKFGQEYTSRNETTDQIDKVYKQKTGSSVEQIFYNFFNDLNRDYKILEIGCNVGMKLSILNKMGFTNLTGLEINKSAYQIAKKNNPTINFINSSIEEFETNEKYDLVFTSGVLIHITPSTLNLVIKKIANLSRNYIFGFEYYADELTEINYRNNTNVCWKQNFPKLFKEILRLKQIKEEKIFHKNKNFCDIIYLFQKSYTTTSDFGDSSGRMFNDPENYIYEKLKETSTKEAQEFLKYRKQWQSTKRLEQEFDFPLYILTEMAFSCNYKCPQCILGYDTIQSDLMPKRSIMSFELFKKIIDEGKAHNCKSLCVNGINEPLLLRDLPERISYARQNGFLDILMNTNGELLNEELSEKLIESGLTRLMVSIDAHSADTFKKIRVGGNYEKVKKNVINLVKIRNQLGKKLPLIRTSFVLQKDNAHELEEFKKYWQSVVDYVHIQYIGKPFETAKESSVGYLNKNKIQETFRCDEPWNRILIRADGSVHPCCSFFNYELHMGNVTNSSIYDVWNSAQFKDLRKLHFEGRYKENKTCKKCVDCRF